jgi:hypothetical protein
MAANKRLNIEPIAVPATVTNLLNCAIASLSGPVGYTQTQPYLIVKHIAVVNNDSSAHTLTLYKGATGASAAGTQFGAAGLSIPANTTVQVFYGEHRFDSGDFLTGIADTASKLVLNIDAEIGLA